jgi:hypothetical protein
MPATITLGQTSDWARKFLFRRPVNIGNQNEPAITSANTILQTIIGPPFIWRWNRSVVGFMTQSGVQDYTLFSWTANTAIKVGYVLLDSNGFSQSVTTAGTTGASIPSFNSTPGQTTTDGTAVWTNMGSVTLTSFNTSYQFGWIENASIKYTDANSAQAIWKEINPKIDLALDSIQDRPHSISAQMDDGNGNVTFRLMPCPDQAYPIAITLQQKPTLMTGMQNTWAPIPDEYSRLYNWGFLALMYLYADDPRFQLANQKFITNLLSTNEGLSETEKNIVLNNWYQVTGQQIVMNDNIVQGRQGRGNL